MLLNKKVFAVSILTSLITSNLNAAGFSIAENSASGMGSAFAGAAAIAEDASTTYFNPAGLSKLKGKEVIFAAHYVAISSEFTNNGSSLNPLLGGGAISGNGNGDDGAVSAFVPNFYYANRLNDKWNFGFGINVPFGNSSDYNDTWVGRYHATKSEITVLNFNPSASYKVNDKLSVGFGVNLQYVEATLENKIDSGAVCLAATGDPITCDVEFGLTLGDAATDSSVSLTGDDLSLGWNVGLLYDISNDTRFGMAYRSNVKHKLEGSAHFTHAGLGAFLSFAGSTLFTDTGISAGLNLPETVSLSLYHAVDSKWSILADATWTKWSRFDKLVVDFANAQPTSTTPENWENSMRYSLGVNYKADSKWTYRAGIALDETPIANVNDITPRIPDNDRIWLSLGFGHKVSDSFGYDVGFSHLIFDDIAINNTLPVFEHKLIGSYDVSVNIFSAQFNWKF